MFNKEMTMEISLKTVVLPDGYNGLTMRFYVQPLERTGDGTVKLQCAEPGKHHMVKWARESDVKEAILLAEEADDQEPFRNGPDTNF
jgi:hypothetical protein